MDPGSESYTDVVELCALLQCMGFVVKSLDTSDCDISQDAGVKTVVVNCQASGIHVVLESDNAFCSCPDKENSGRWEVSGITGGKQCDKEFGSTMLIPLPKSHRDRLSWELRKILKEIIASNAEQLKENITSNKSTSMTEINTPQKSKEPKADTPTRYRSLDTLIATKEADHSIPMPKPLSDGKMMLARQSTYSLSSTDSIRRINKTSSPIQSQQESSLNKILDAEKAAGELHRKLVEIVKDMTEDKDTSVSSLDVSKISILKGAEISKTQCVSSPNLSGIRRINEDFKKGSLKRLQNASTAKLQNRGATSKDGSKALRFPRLSSSIFKKKDGSSVKVDEIKTPEVKTTKTNTFPKSKLVTPVRVPKVNSEIVSNFSASKKRYSHVKSTIPNISAKK